MIGKALLCLFYTVSCTPLRQTLQMENRLFVRVRGTAITEPADAFGWSFRHMVEGPKKGGGHSQWYMLYRKEDRRDRLYHAPFMVPWLHARKLAPEIADACMKSLGAYPELVEPALIFSKSVAKKSLDPKIGQCSGNGQPPVLRAGSLPATVFSSKKTPGTSFIDPEWHLDEDHSQLASARATVRRQAAAAAREIKIGIIDTGFDLRHAALPRQLTNEKAGDAIQFLRPENFPCGENCPGSSTPGHSLGEHGMGALGILAAPKVRLVADPKKPGSVSPGEDGQGELVEFGAAPDAKIVAVRVAPWVASLSTANLAYAIDYASRQKGCDVISMSHGGSPSQMWTDAVNAAYERGTAMFAATGDYFALPVPGRLNRLGFLFPPSSTVYPAAYRRVMGVAGVTADGKPYAKTDWGRWLGGFWQLGRNGAHILMRGSYGADRVLRSLADGSTGSEKGKTDPSMTKRDAELRANPISAFTPAIPWLAAGKSKDTARPDVVHLDGAGTSSAAPQAAAAAAHWLALNRSKMTGREWNSWKKAESVYTAMTYHADRPWVKDSDPLKAAPADQPPDVFLGSGILKANEMLKMDFDEAQQVRGKTLTHPSLRPGDPEMGARFGAPMDFYDGDRSFYAVVCKLSRRSHVEHRHRAQLNEKRDPGRERTSALERLFFNMLLVERWQYGRVPRNPEGVAEAPWHDVFTNTRVHESELLSKAGRLAKGAPPPLADDDKPGIIARIFSARF